MFADTTLRLLIFSPGTVQLIIALTSIFTDEGSSIRQERLNPFFTGMSAVGPSMVTLGEGTKRRR